MPENSKLLKNTKKCYADLLFFLAVLAVYFVAGAYLHYMQGFYEPGDTRYYSDIAVHMRWAMYQDSFLEIPGQAKFYPLFHLTVRAFSVFFDTQMSVALTLMSYNALTAVILKLALTELLADELPGKSGARKITLLVFSLLFCSMLIVPGLMEFKYLGQFTPNPWHNATYTAAKPFAVASFFLFAKLLAVYDTRLSDAKPQKKPFGLYALFSAVFFFCVAAKPSFAAVFLPAAGLVLLVRLVRARFGNLDDTLIFGCAFIPAFALLAVQYLGVFADGGAVGGFSIKLASVWGDYSRCIPLSILLGLAFPIYVLASGIGDAKRSKLYHLAWAVFASAFLQALLFDPAGDFHGYADFFWGYMYGMLLLFIVSAVSLVKKSALKKSVRCAAGWVLFAAHTATGIAYFIYVLLGYSYS